MRCGAKSVPETSFATDSTEPGLGNAVVDARMDFKLETCHSDVDSGCVKCQPEWVQLFAELLRSKRANIQFGYVVHLPRETKGLDTRQSLGLIVESWHVLEPVLDKVRGNAESAGR